LTRLAPPILFGGLFFHLRLPASPAIWLASAASVGAAILVSFGIRFAIALSGFWLLEGQGVQGIVGLLIVVSSGWMVPLVLFPPGVAAVARNLPFAALAQLPIEVFLGKQHGWDFVTVLGRQLAWAVAFILGGRLLLSRATRRLVVQGG
jgi:ABC-2 type transport system permease protein